MSIYEDAEDEAQARGVSVEQVKSENRQLYADTDNSTSGALLQVAGMVVACAVIIYLVLTYAN